MDHGPDHRPDHGITGPCHLVSLSQVLGLVTSCNDENNIGNTHNTPVVGTKECIDQSWAWTKKCFFFVFFMCSLVCEVCLEINIAISN